jgi:hypothetical protein
MIISINYDDVDAKSYVAVQVRPRIGEEQVFNTGDFVKDWFHANKWIVNNWTDEEIHLRHSSSVDHFIMDGGGNLYDSRYLSFDEDYEPILIEYTENMGSCIEVFIPKNSNFTWGQLKEYCNHV